MSSLCEAVRIALLVDAEGERMDEELQKAVEKHLKDCAACREAREKGGFSG